MVVRREARRLGRVRRALLEKSRQIDARQEVHAALERGEEGVVVRGDDEPGAQVIEIDGARVARVLAEVAGDRVEEQQFAVGRQVGAARRAIASKQVEKGGLEGRSRSKNLSS